MDDIVFVSVGCGKDCFNCNFFVGNYFVLFVIDDGSKVCGYVYF